MIVHETDEEEDTDGEVDPEVAQPERSEPQPQPQPLPAQNRGRKAKESQTRLGVGRPVVAGGSGARAITKPPSVSKQKRGKSKGTKPTEATIPEGRSQRSLLYKLAEQGCAQSQNPKQPIYLHSDVITLFHST